MFLNSQLCKHLLYRNINTSNSAFNSSFYLLEQTQICKLLQTLGLFVYFFNLPCEHTRRLVPIVSKIVLVN